MLRLENLSAEELRKHWSEHVNDDTMPDAIRDVAFQRCWDTWLTKFKGFNHRPEDMAMLRTFLAGRNPDKLELKGIDNKRRARLHALSDDLGLLHQSTGQKSRNSGEDKGQNRVLVISKKPQWAWEYSGPNAEAKPRESQKQIAKERKMLDKFCEFCSCTNEESTLCVSCSCPFICCEDCLLTATDDNGGSLSPYKWEELEECI
jgi:hypothetical protein